MDVDSGSPHSNSTSSSSDDSSSQLHDEQHEQLVAQASQLAVSWVVDSVDETALMQQSARDRAESRRARHREVQRRFAQRKKEKLVQDRELLRRLEATYRLLSLSAEEKQLSAENEDLSASCLAHTLASPPKPVIHSVIESQMESVRASYEPVTSSQWAELLQQSLQEYEVSRQRGPGGWTSTGATILGWRDRVMVQESNITMSMEKDFEHLDSREFAERAWHRLGSSKYHPKMFSHGLIVKVQVLQQINVDAFVINRCMYNPRTNAIGHTIEIFCRVLRGRDTIIISRTLERTSAQQHVVFQQPHHDFQRSGMPAGQQWPQLMASFAFSDIIGGRGCHFRYACRLGNFTIANATYWMNELPTVIWRFEAITVAPIFSLVGEDGTPSSNAGEGYIGSTMHHAA